MKNHKKLAEQMRTTGPVMAPQGEEPSAPSPQAAHREFAKGAMSGGNDPGPITNNPCGASRKKMR